MPDQPLLEVDDLRVRFRTGRGRFTAVDGLSFSVRPGEVLGIVGESGSGKSVSMLGVLRLIRTPNAEISGSVIFRGRDLLSLKDKEMRAVRGREIAMIFQDPMTALTPVYTVGWQIAEQIRAHERISKRQARDRAVKLLDEVGIPAPGKRVDSYPHEFSGGMRQRVVIAMALSCNPGLLIADEPTTALDVTTQAQILDLMRRLRTDHGSAIVMITHDMGVVSEIADEVLVMYGGRAVERGPRGKVFHAPRHPYTWGLLDSVPRVGGPRVRRLPTIPGAPGASGGGCPFADRCVHRHHACDEVPPLVGVAGHLDACLLPREGRERIRRGDRDGLVASPARQTALAADEER
ncbi:ABC transporter ATP-binding protein [Streptosporangium sp. NBC_01755]|uniref:ABC transporter ATP-binding protein n=1 Tax=unclassified Streptosporangium TaxID=2632669 RepID=UPI002DDB04F4|nr:MULTISPECIES: ABC transporter ATP-binding protein [unclassified Streptosporangium]WSA23487.1 ABC transporter ATP-binding protein [Streptosporangium sp. NBC_01810]WSC98305.1 ABC transporter ATP-binding protein [Streptosporangium sp. NBC_01755]